MADKKVAPKVHGLIFDDKQKLQLTILAALLFALISSPFLYKLVHSLLGKFLAIALPSGCPTNVGLAVHTVVFALLFRLVMEIKI